jgi:hypothetical protein
MILHWPQITYLALSMLGLGVTMAKHGESKGEYNVLASLIVSIILIWILGCGGFFG